MRGNLETPQDFKKKVPFTETGPRWKIQTSTSGYVYTCGSAQSNIRYGKERFRKKDVQGGAGLVLTTQELK